MLQINKQILSLSNNIKFNKQEFKKLFHDEIPYLYHYTKWNTHAVDFLEFKRFYLAPANKMNDLMEFQRKLDFTDLYPSQEKALNECVKQIDKDDRENTGILSFTSDNENQMMWNFYADNYKGICLEFNSDMIWNIFNGEYEGYYAGTFGKVKYGDYPTWNMMEEACAPFEKFFYKLKEWSSEVEYRYISFLSSAVKEVGKSYSYYLNYKEEFLTGIYCGYKMKRQDKNLVYSLAKRTNENVKVYEVVNYENSYKFEFKEYNPR